MTPFAFEARCALKVGRLLGDLPDLVRRDFGFTRPGVIVDGGALDGSELIREVVEHLAESFPGAVVHEYREPFEPTYGFLDRVTPGFTGGTEPVDCMIGIGGGSVIDTAKGVATLVTNPGPSLAYRGFPEGLNPTLPVIAVPTTAGTGSEVAFNAVFTDEREKKKLGINYRGNYPVLGILDPRAVASAPKSVWAAAGVDALVHTLESFASRQRSELSKAMSREAFRLLFPALTALANGETDLEVWSGAQIGASLAMLALSNASSGPTGALSYYLGAQFDVPHGTAGGAFIGWITSVNHERGFRDYAELYPVIEPHVTGVARSVEARSAAVVAAIETLIAELGIPRELRAFGLTEADLGGLEAFAVGPASAAFALNSIEISSDEIGAGLARLL